jgi:hypothetical protein
MLSSSQFEDFWKVIKLPLALANGKRSFPDMGFSPK